jgi:elongation factor 2 kinase
MSDRVLKADQETISSNRSGAELKTREIMTKSGTSLISSVTYTKLQNLKSLYEEGFITETEYTARKSQLVDQLTGTSMKKVQEEERKERPMRTVIARPPPKWDDIDTERAIKITYDIFKRNWNEEPATIKVDRTPFASGALRVAYHMLDLGIPDDSTFVLKISNDPNENADVYYRDVEMQLFAYLIAEKFNIYKPPKQVAFVKAWLVKLPRRGGQLCAVERFISGPYRKHNNNFGFVNEDERNTPQAFSHFSYEVSAHNLLICDIQGVADMYTDPQIHTVAGDDKHERPFGKGNLGQRGIDQFLKTHRCNPICRYLRLPPINPRIEDTDHDIGTVPVDATVMENNNIDIIRIRVSELPGGRLAINALGPQTVVGETKTVASVSTTPEPTPNPPPTKMTDHIPLITGTNKKTKITITAEESSSCACC